MARVFKDVVTLTRRISDCRKLESWRYIIIIEVIMSITRGLIACVTRINFRPQPSAKLQLDEMMLSASVGRA